MRAPPPVNTALFAAGGFRYTEQLVGVGAQLCVVGEFRSQSETGDLGAATAAKLHEWKNDQKTLLARFDADHDGTLSAGEWKPRARPRRRNAKRRTCRPTSPASASSPSPPTACGRS